MDYGSAEDVYEVVRIPSTAHCFWQVARRLTSCRRLNTKIEPRDLLVKDLVQDLSDGVSSMLQFICAA
jgi:hypothetical protein